MTQPTERRRAGFAMGAAIAVCLGLGAGGGAAQNATQDQPPDATQQRAPAAGAPEDAAGGAATPAATEDTAAPLESDAGPAAAPATGTGTTPTPAAGAAPAAPADAAPTRPAGAGGTLVIASWGGVYSRSQDEAVYRPFTRATGIEISRKVYAGDLDAIRVQVSSGEPVWDVVDVEPADAEEGCNEGLFQKLSFVLPSAPDGTAGNSDFLPGTLQACAIGSLAWSVMIAYDAGPGEIRADDAPPDDLADLFDLERFPGRRGLRRTPMVNLEWALLADGVAPTRVYDLLRTEAGVARAFAPLDTNRDEIVWWEDAGEPARLLAEDRVVMTSTFNAPMFNAIAVRGQPFGMIWDHQVWDIDLWAVPAAAPNREAALEFVRFATSTQPLARQTRWIPYGPVRRSSLDEVGDYVHADVEMSAFLPTSEENFATALRNDALFWREQGPALVQRFNDWLAR
jgi:putative spermidine/putrescine transport system substrate-binding protein